MCEQRNGNQVEEQWGHINLRLRTRNPSELAASSMRVRLRVHYAKPHPPRALAKCGVHENMLRKQSQITKSKSKWENRKECTPFSAKKRQICARTGGQSPKTRRYPKARRELQSGGRTMGVHQPSAKNKRYPSEVAPPARCGCGFA